MKKTAGIEVSITNISPYWNEDDLRVLFEAFGRVSWVELQTEVDGTTQEAGLVKMVNDEAAREAIAALDQVVISGRRIRVREVSKA